MYHVFCIYTYYHILFVLYAYVHLLYHDPYQTYIYIHTHVYRVQTGVYPGASCCFNNGFWLIDLAYQHVVDRCFFISLGDEQVILKMLFWEAF